MNKLIKNLSILSLMFSVPVLADHQHHEYGRVVSAEPVYHYVEHSTPVTHCYPQKHRKYRRHYSTYHHSATPTIVGAIVGGAIGHAIGHNKTNKKIGLAAGAILGGSIGHDVSKNHSHKGHGYRRHDYQVNSHRHYSYRKHGYRNHHSDHYYAGEHCSVTYEYGPRVKKLKGYNVTYRYKGDRYYTFTKHHPGKRIRLQVNVTPADYDY